MNPPVQYVLHRVDTKIPQETYTAEGGYSFFLLGDTRKNITLNFALTGVIGYETINRGETLLYDGAKILTEDNFIYGAGVRLSFEKYLSDRFVVILQGRTKVLWVQISNTSDHQQALDYDLTFKNRNHDSNIQ